MAWEGGSQKLRKPSMPVQILRESCPPEGSQSPDVVLPLMVSWRKALTWLGAIAFFEVGARIALFGVDTLALLRYFDQAGRPALVSLFAFITGGGLFRGGMLALGIMPYLTARIYMRLWRVVKPDADTSRFRTRLLTGALSVVQAVGFATFLQKVPGAVSDPGPGFIATTVLTLTATSLIMMWFGERLTESDEPADDEPLSDLPERPEASPALPAPERPASPPHPPRSSSDAETLRTRR